MQEVQLINRADLRFVGSPPRISPCGFCLNSILVHHQHHHCFRLIFLARFTDSVNLSKKPPNFSSDNPRVSIQFFSFPRSFCNSSQLSRSPNSFHPSRQREGRCMSTTPRDIRVVFDEMRCGPSPRSPCLSSATPSPLSQLSVRLCDSVILPCLVRPQLTHRANECRRSTRWSSSIPENIVLEAATSDLRETRSPF